MPVSISRPRTLPSPGLLSEELAIICSHHVRRESPRWYIKHGKAAKAYQSLLKLRNHPLLAARDLYYISTQIQIEHEIVGNSTYISRFGQLFTMPRVRRATLASFVVMIAQREYDSSLKTIKSSEN